MNTAEFELWKRTIQSLDRYENPTDARMFVKLVKDVQNQLDSRVIDALLDTFSNSDDYGIQEYVLAVLDKADAKLYAEILERKFPDILRDANHQEWPLLLIGRVINSNEKDKIKAIAEIAEQRKGGLYYFIHSEHFVDEYPEIEPYLQH